jgi:hypothetical protein
MTMTGGSLTVTRRWILLASAGAVAVTAATFVPAFWQTPASEAATTSAEVAWRPISQPVAATPVADSAFVRLIERISEPGGYFDTDNLISNESSYLHVIADLRNLSVSGGAYIGVGPDQNFSYIATIQPRIAFLLDIRRDNLLEHLLFKAVLAMAPTRVEFLSHLFARPVPEDRARYDGDIEAILGWVDGQAADAAYFERIAASVADTVRTYGLDLSDEDFATIRRFHATFFASGLSLRFNSFGRAPRPYYPTYRQLVLETDRDGTRAGWLASAASYAFIRRMQAEHRVVPVVGDLSGSHALREIGNVLRERGDSLSAFYASNVEYYLMQDGTFDRFAENLASLPVHSNAVIIRSLFGRGFGHPRAVSGYYSTQLLQSVPTMLRIHRSGEITGYGDLVYRDYVR